MIDTEAAAVAHAADVLRARLDDIPAIAVVLGSGLGAFAERLAESVVVAAADIPEWPTPRVVGHAGRIAAGVAGGRRILVLSGRVHFYEGHAINRVTFPVRVLARSGVRTLVLTNAAGGINPRFRAGALMLIDDHISLFVPNPLIGPHDDSIGPRFPDMSQVYSPRLRTIAREAAAAAGVPLTHGVYAAVTGPSYETPAEIRALRGLGADAVGMSTVSEAIVARHRGLEVLGLSCITNSAAGMRSTPLSAAEVLETARASQDRLSTLLEAIIARL